MYFKNIFFIIKPGIVIGNIIVLLGSFKLSLYENNIFTFNNYTIICMILGLTFIISSACIFNNIIDQDIDKIMSRTKYRPLVKGTISIINSIILGILFLLSGLIFIFQVNSLSCIVSISGFFLYVIFYSLIYKRKNIINSLILGGIAGAIPAIVGFTSVNNSINTTAIISFFIVFFWQISHYLAITIYRRKDLKKAKLPILSINTSIKYIILSNIMFINFILILCNIININFLYKILYYIISFNWLVFNIFGLFTKNKKTWSKKSFIFSIISIIGINILHILL